MPITFKCKTNTAYTIKVLAELLQNNLKTACLEIDTSGIKLVMMDFNRSILISFELASENFTIYKFKVSKMFIGLNLNHFHKMLKSIKKKDSLQLYIDDSQPNELNIKVIPRENNRITTSIVKIQSIQKIDITIPTGYDNSIIVQSSEYQKLVKDMSHIGNIISVRSKDHHIEFKCDAGGVLQRIVEFGELDDKDDDDDDKQKKNTVSFYQTFDTEQLSRITKISGLSSNIKICPKEGLPLLFKTNVGILGEISIYIKSKEQVEKENCNVESDED